MKKVLFITNKEVPYKVEFFNQLAQKCDLTVVFATRDSGTRNEKWAKSVNNKFKYYYMNNNESFFNNLKICSFLKQNYDKIIVGSYNCTLSIVAILYMKIFNINYSLDIDGEYYIRKRNIKNLIKKYLLKGAETYFVAGEKCAEEIKNTLLIKETIVYYFSSLTENEILNNNANSNANSNSTSQEILIVGQYNKYKGLDVAIKCALLNPKLKFKFIGAGDKSHLLLNDIKQLGATNIEVIPFLSREELNEEYKKCKIFLLPSTQECWGLVINEAASFGIPIISTYGSGAAVEFLSDKYEKYLAIPGNFQDLSDKIKLINNEENISEYKKYLIEKSRLYTIERTVEKFISNM